MELKSGDMAVVVADLPSFDGDEHGVPLQTVVTVHHMDMIGDREAAYCRFYNCGAYQAYFYLDELAVVE